METRSNVPTDTQWAYLAGILDGEGCITIHRSKPWTPGRRPRHVASVDVVNSNEAMIAWIHATFGGSRYDRKKQRDFHKQTWAWNVAAQNSVRICTGTLPYLIAKREQALIVLELMNENYGQRTRGLDITPAEVDRRDACWHHIKSLNRKGDEQRLSERNPDAMSGDMRQSEPNGNIGRQAEPKRPAPENMRLW